MLKNFLASLFTVSLVTFTSGIAFAADFTPSVEAKPAPPIVSMKDLSGATVDAIIYDTNGNEVIGVPTGGLTVTPISEVNQATENIRNMLQTAYDQLNSPNSIEVLRPVLELSLGEISDDLSVDDLVIVDLFDVSIPQSYEDYLTYDGNKMMVRFAVDISQNAPLIAMINCDILAGEDWHVIPQNNITRNQDGSVSITFDKFCPVIFLTDGGQITIDPTGPKSPQTGDNLYLYMLFVAATAVFAIMYMGFRRRHKASR